MTPKKSEKKSQHSVYLWSTIPSVTSENFEKVVLWDTLVCVCWCVCGHVWVCVFVCLRICVCVGMGV